MKFVVISLLVGQVAMAEAAPAPGSGGLTPFIPMILIFGIFYFLVLRPQQKKAKAHEKFVSDLKRGDMVVTSSGIIGIIKVLGEKFVTLEIDEGVCMKVLRSQIAEAANALKEDVKAKTLATNQS